MLRRRRPIPCSRCLGQGITYQEVSRLGGTLARRPCRYCGGRGTR